MSKPKLKTFIVTECANYITGNKPFCCNQHDGQCLIIQHELPCTYFRESVLPLIDPNRTIHERYLTYKEAYFTYSFLDHSISKYLKKQPPPERLCACGQTLNPKQRLCNKCKKLNKLKKNKIKKLPKT